MNPSGILCDIELNMKLKQKGHWSMLKETWRDYLIYGAVTSTI